LLYQNLYIILVFAKLINLSKPLFFIDLFRLINYKNLSISFVRLIMLSKSFH